MGELSRRIIRLGQRIIVPGIARQRFRRRGSDLRSLRHSIGRGSTRSPALDRRARDVVHPLENQKSNRATTSVLQYPRESECAWSRQQPTYLEGTPSLPARASRARSRPSWLSRVAADARRIAGQTRIAAGVAAGELCASRPSTSSGARFVGFRGQLLFHEIKSGLRADLH